MKKRLLGLFITLSIILTVFTGCSKNIFKEFTSASAKTAQVQKATESVNFQLNIDPTGLTLTPEQQQMFSLYSDAKGTINVNYDKENKLSYSDITLGLSGISLDLKAYSRDNKEIVQVPMINKYIVIDSNTLNKSTADNSKAQAEIANKLSDILNQTVTKNNLKSNGNKTINIDGKDIVTTEYKVTLNDAEIKKVASGLIDTIFNNDQFKASIENSIKAQNPSITDSELEQQLNQSKEQLQSSLKGLKIDNFTISGDIDKDSYIVQQNASITMEIPVQNVGNAKVNLSLTSKLSNIGKAVTVNMPETNSSNSLTLEQLLNNSGSLLKGTNL